jgi:NAD-dependent dihydropyrimidine dehydrogenase PreA subunit
MSDTLVFFRACEGERQARELETALAGLCRAAGLDVIFAPHFYHVPEGSGLWEELRRVPGPRAYATWIYPRPAEALLRFRDVWRDGDIAFHIAAENAPEAIWQELRRAMDRPASNGEKLGSVPAGSVRALDFPSAERWYPVVDPSRCKHCGSCAQFCLFGVYATDAEKKVRVANPDRCKPGCPACSRICPEGAIMFPLYLKDPAIAGAPGLFMKPDASARRMFYLRTGLRCPACGAAGKDDPRGQGPVCQECGRSTAAARGAPGGREPSAGKEPGDELDALIDGLEKVMRRSH